MKKLSIATSRWVSPNHETAEEPRDRLEETRAYANELEERIAKLEDVVFILTGRKSSVPPAPAGKGVWESPQSSEEYAALTVQWPDRIRSKP